VPAYPAEDASGGQAGDAERSAIGPRMRKTITVVIPTYNVERVIARCLEALQWADEVNIVDMYSTDRTREICERYPNVRFYQNQDYIYGNVNYGIQRASHAWVMRLDSDEVVTPVGSGIDDHTSYVTEPLATTPPWVEAVMDLSS